jgi:regulator of sirC expression with transglutaminase-like and TPR domain
MQSASQSQTGEAAPDAVTLHDDADIRVVATRHAAPGAIITFSSLNEHVRGFGQDFLDRQGISGVFCIAKWNHWYQPPGLRAALPAIRAHLASLPPGPRMTYGASMGGFAAALHSGRLDADTVLMLSPQFSNDPAKPPHETRWAREAARIRFEDDDILPAISRRARKFVVFDSAGEDTAHAALFAQVENTVLLPTPRAGHAMGHFLLQTRLLQDLVLRAFRGELDWPWYRAAVRRQRRLSGNYWRELARIARPRRPDLALECLGRAAALRPRDSAILNDYGNALLRAGWFETAAEIFRAAAAGIPEGPAPLRGLAFALHRLGRPAEAVEAAERALAFRPDSTDLQRVLAQMLAAAGETDRARAMAERLVEAEPEVAENRRLLARIAEAAKA